MRTYIGTMNDWMRDILRRVEKLERRRPRVETDPALLARVQTLEAKIASLEQQLNDGEQP